MAIFQGNTTRPSAVDPKTGVKASSDNFINLYSHYQQYSPDKLEKLVMKHGKGKLTKVTEMLGNTRFYASDTLTHAEMGRLQQVSTNVSVSGDVFTCNEAHNLRPNEVIEISDGLIKRTAIVSSVTSPTVFVAENEEDGAFGFTSTVSLFASGNKWGKGEENFKTGKAWGLDTITNNTQIIKEAYFMNRSDVASVIWVDAPQYPGGRGWFSVELNRTLDLYDNEIEYTHLFGRRATDGSAAAAAGKAQGAKGLVQQIEERGNVGNEYISTKSDLEEYAYRLKQQGTCRVLTAWADHSQMNKFSDIASSLNAAFDAGANYGMFKNGKNMALEMDFTTLTRSGVTYHTRSLDILDDPTYLGAEKIKDIAPACLLVPSGDKKVTEDGNAVTRPFFSTAYRQKDNMNRYREIEFFGKPFGTPIEKDEIKVLCTTEQSNQLIGAENFFVVNKTAGFYS
tara:strand:- start:1621 stop:2979 length:1359 start_codon:yes stop_codon:yes gene_type:complete